MVCSCSKVHACTSTADGPKSVHDCALRCAVSALHFHYWNATVQEPTPNGCLTSPLTDWLTDWGLCWVTDGLTGGLLEGKSMIFWNEIKELWYQTICFVICKNNNAFHNTERSKSEQAVLINSALFHYNLKCLGKTHRALIWSLTPSYIVCAEHQMIPRNFKSFINNQTCDFHLVVVKTGAMLIVKTWKYFCFIHQIILKKYHST